MFKFTIAMLLSVMSMYSTTTSANMVNFIFDENQYFSVITNSSDVSLPNSGTGQSILAGGDLLFQTFGANQLSFGQSSTLIPNSDLAISGKEDFQIIGPNMFGLSFLAHEPTTNGNNQNTIDTCNSQCTESVFQISVFNNVDMLDSIQIGLNNDATTFVGITSQKSFNRVIINEIIGTADNEFFGRFALSEVQAVPEPQTYAMLLAGLGLLGFASRKKK